MNILLRRFICFMLSSSILAVMSCSKVLKASVNPRFVEAKTQGEKIRSAVRYYSFDHRQFPENLGMVDIGWNERTNTLGTSNIVWIYSQTESGKSFSLRTSEKIDGYFVYLDDNGEISASKMAP